MCDKQRQQQSGRHRPVANISKDSAQRHRIDPFLDGAQRLIGALPEQCQDEEAEQQQHGQTLRPAAQEDRCDEADSREPATGDHREDRSIPARNRV